MILDGFIIKGKKTGYYLDTAENRKKGQVGKKYTIEVTDPSKKNRIQEQLDRARNSRDATREGEDSIKRRISSYEEQMKNVLEGDKGYVESLDFKSFKTPSEWNTKAKKQIRTLWSKMTDWSKENVIENIITD